jgi:hypothetical protein
MTLFRGPSNSDFEPENTYIRPCTVKKFAIFPSQARMSLTNSPWPGIIKLFTARETLVSDIPAGDRKTANLFLSVCSKSRLISLHFVNIFLQKKRGHGKKRPMM